MNKCASMVAAGLVAILWFGCSSTVLVKKPPRFALSTYGAIGIIEFSSNDHNGLAELTTRQFIQAMQKAQPGTVVLELGPEDEVLRKVGKSGLDFETVRTIGTRFNVDAVVTGFIETSDVKPRLNLSLDLSSVRAQAKVHGTVGAKIYETERGGTAWTAERSGEWTLANVSGGLDELPEVGVSDRETKMKDMVSTLSYKVTEDFCPRYVRERKKK